MSSTASTTQVVRPARTVRSSVRLPGDKSISQRCAMLAGLAHGTSTVANYYTRAGVCEFPPKSEGLLTLRVGSYARSQ